MSVVVALKQDGVIYMGADTACTSGLTYNTVRGSLAKLSKIGHTLIGFTGDSCSRQVIIGHPEILDCGEEGLTRRWIVTQFIPKYRELCQEMGWLEENVMLSTDVFLAQKDTLYTIANWTVTKVENYCAMGSGSTYAMPILADEALPPKERILGALRMAAMFDHAVERPFVLYNTKDFKYREVAK